MSAWRKESTAPTSSTPAAHDVHSILGPESSFDGKLTFRGSVRLDGHFQGEIVAEGSLIVGPQAVLRANAQVGHLVVFGEVEGDLKASEAIEIHANAKVRGNVQAPSVMLEKGAFFEGSCRMQTAHASLENVAKPTRLSAVDAVAETQLAH